MGDQSDQSEGSNARLKRRVIRTRSTTVEKYVPGSGAVPVKEHFRRSPGHADSLEPPEEKRGLLSRFFRKRGRPPATGIDKTIDQLEGS